MSRAGKWRLNRRSLFPWTWIPGVVRLFGVCKKQERIICAFWTVESFLRISELGMTHTHPQVSCTLKDFLTVIEKLKYMVI